MRFWSQLSLNLLASNFLLKVFLKLFFRKLPATEKESLRVRICSLMISVSPEEEKVELDDVE